MRGAVPRINREQAGRLQVALMKTIANSGWRSETKKQHRIIVVAALGKYLDGGGQITEFEGKYFWEGQKSFPCGLSLDEFEAAILEARKQTNIHPN